MTAPDLTGAGTPEAAWQPELAALPELALSELALSELALPDVPTAGRVVVVAPHPDDEVLGAGGLMRLLAGTGARIVVVAVTDGEGSHPDSPTLRPGELIRRRRGERARALSKLGLSDVEVVRLGLPDGEVRGHEPWLTAELGRHLGAGDLCLAPWSRDGHPDHDAAGRAAVAAATTTGARSLGFLVWMWHWAEPGDGTLPWPAMGKVSLTTEVAAAKRSAVSAFTSQLRPLSAHPADAAILPAPILDRLTRDHEVFVR